MKVKICGIRFRDNLLEMVKLMPDFIGFNFYAPSPRYMMNDLSSSDMNIVPANIKKVGVFVNEEVSRVTDLKLEYGLDLVQLHGNENPGICRNLHSNGINIIKAFGIGKQFNFKELNDYLPWCAYFIFDNQSVAFGGSGLGFNWDILREYEFETPFFLSGGIGPEDTGRIKKLHHAFLAGVDINSRFETNPGRKDARMIKKFLNSLHNKNE